jgi:hypothetical protein
MAEDLVLTPPPEPRRLTPRQMEVIAQLRAGNTRKMAWASIQSDEGTFLFWMRFDAPFREAVQQAEALAEADAVAVIRAVMDGGQLKRRRERKLSDGSTTTEEEFTTPDWRAAAWWLEHQRPGAWCEVRKIDANRLSADTLIAFLEASDRAEGGPTEGEIDPDPAAPRNGPATNRNDGNDASSQH